MSTKHPQFPEESLDKLETEFFKLADCIAQNDPKITDAGEAISFLSTACMGIICKMLFMSSRILKESPEESRKLFVEHLNGFDFNLKSTH